VTVPLALPVTVPVDPDAGEARRLLLEELAKSEYQAAQPTWFDRLSAAFFDWLGSLQFGGAGGPPGLGVLVVVLVVVVLLVVAFLVFGVPRLNRSSAVGGELFGVDDARSAAQIRQAAEAAAARGDLSLAVAELFRSIARSLVERTVLSPSPGTTAHAFAERAGAAFPALAGQFALSATDFDGVRYLGRDGTREQYDALDRLDRAVAAATPVLQPVRS
jgi:hypothetical protein